MNMPAAEVTLPSRAAVAKTGVTGTSVRQPFDEASAGHHPRGFQRRYHQLLRGYYAKIVPAAQRVVELGCGPGDLLAAVHATRGVGVDFSPAMIELGRQRYPQLDFHVASAEVFASLEPFDYIILSDLVNDLYDVQELLVHLHGLAHSRTRLVINFFNHLWRPVLSAAEWLGLKSPLPPQNWLSTVTRISCFMPSPQAIMSSTTRP